MIQILIVDDHKIVRDGLQSILHLLTGEIQVLGEAATGREAIAFLERQKEEGPLVDVVLMDISMPSGSIEIPMNGLDATRYIRQHFPKVKVLLLTMLDKEQFVLEASQSGAHGYILKTAGYTEILHAIRTLHEGEEYFSAEVTKILIRKLQSDSPARNREPARESQATSPAAAQANDSLTGAAGLTVRELEVLQCIAQGHTTNEISERLFTSRRTIEIHRQNMLTKTQSSNTAALIRFAVQQGLVQ